MIKLSLNRIIALAALAVVVAFAVMTTAQTQPATPAAGCATAQLKLNSATPKAGDALTATVSVANCSAEVERLVIKYSYTDPCGETTPIGTAALRLKAGATQPAQINFQAPAAADGCAGAFKINAVVSAAGNELTTASTNFSVRAQ